MQEGGGGGSGNLAEGAETSVLYVRFRAAAPELRPLMEEMESRANRREYHQVPPSQTNLPPRPPYVCGHTR